MRRFESFDNTGAWGKCEVGVLGHELLINELGTMVRVFPERRAGYYSGRGMEHSDQNEKGGYLD
jgi:hypothetical protein